MKHILSLFTALAFSLSVLAQQADTIHQIAIKLNAQATLDGGPVLNDPVSGVNMYADDIIMPTFSIQLRARNLNLHEIELNGLKVSETSMNNFSNVEAVTTRIALRYEYIVGFLKHKDTRVKPSLGLAIMPYYQHNIEYPFKEQYTGCKFFVIPHISCSISSRVFIDLNTPLCFADIYNYHVRYKIYTPGVEDQRESSFNMEAIPTYLSGRLGVGIKL